MIQTDHFPQIEVSSLSQLRSRLTENHHQLQTVWLITYKKIIPSKYLSRRDVLDELICFGWIDGIRRMLDDTRTMQLISPRKVHHRAQTYKDRYAVLEQQGRMTDAGRKYVQISKELGLRDMMDDVDQGVIPDDLMQELNNYKGAREFFEGCSPSSKRFMLRHIKLAKTLVTRIKRTQQVAILASQNKKIHGC